MSQFKFNQRVVVGIWRTMHDLSTPLDVSNIPGHIVQVVAERNLQRPGFTYDLTIVYRKDSNTTLAKYRKLVRVSDKVRIEAGFVDQVGIAQERPSAEPFAALVVMSGTVEPTCEFPDNQEYRNPYISNPNLDGESSIYYVKPENGDVVCLSEHIFLANSYDKLNQGLGYYRVAASSLVGAVSISREYFAKLGMLDSMPQAPAKPLAQAHTPAKAPQRTYLQIDDLEVGKIYQGFCLDEPTPKNIFEAGETQKGVKVVRALGGRMWMDKDEMRPFVFTELELVPYEQAMAEYKKGV
ncbi:hypothetical protein Knedl_CDS0010 [Pseudomonas phage Knedl]|nr:hypothetical protein Knedl_CDS0010 [Pseudomonas phage Knedl]